MSTESDRFGLSLNYKQKEKGYREQALKLLSLALRSLCPGVHLLSTFRTDCPSYRSRSHQQPNRWQQLGIVVYLLS